MGSKVGEVDEPTIHGIEYSRGCLCGSKTFIVTKRLGSPVYICDKCHSSGQSSLSEK